MPAYINCIIFFAPWTRCKFQGSFISMWTETNIIYLHRRYRLAVRKCMHNFTMIRKFYINFFWRGYAAGKKLSWTFILTAQVRSRKKLHRFKYRGFVSSENGKAYNKG
jgi:hypothetical protein